MKQNMDENKTKKIKTQEADDENDVAFDEDSLRVSDDPPLRATPLTSQRGNNSNRIGDYFVPITTAGAQPTLKSVLQSNKVVEKCGITSAR